MSWQEQEGGDDDSSLCSAWIQEMDNTTRSSARRTIGNMTTIWGFAYAFCMFLRFDHVRNRDKAHTILFVTRHLYMLSPPEIGKLVCQRQNWQSI